MLSFDLSGIVATLGQPCPWYVAGPLIGSMVPLLLIIGNRMFGISSNLRHVCAAALPGRTDFFRYDWRGAGGWNLSFALGIFGGGALAALLLGGGDPVALAPAARDSIAALGIRDFSGLMPREIFHWGALATTEGLVIMVGGGFLVGFGASYAGGCTSGHAISGLADLQLPSVLAVFGFFAGGLVSTWLILPRLMGA